MSNNSVNRKKCDTNQKNSESTSNLDDNLNDSTENLTIVNDNAEELIEPLSTEIAEDLAATEEGATSAASGNAETSALADLDNSSNDKEGDKDFKKKKNRCAVCRKKVGLTGFECRCGGLFCGVHRYSDKHNCTFDYREMGAQEIRRNNPVVVGEKIQKI